MKSRGMRITRMTESMTKYNYQMYSPEPFLLLVAYESLPQCPPSP